MLGLTVIPAPLWKREEEEEEGGGLPKKRGEDGLGVRRGGSKVGDRMTFWRGKRKKSCRKKARCSCRKKMEVLLLPPSSLNCGKIARKCARSERRDEYDGAEKMSQKNASTWDNYNFSFFLIIRNYSERHTHASI